MPETARMLQEQQDFPQPSLLPEFLMFVEMESLLLKPYSGQTFADNYIELPSAARVACHGGRPSPRE